MEKTPIRLVCADRRETVKTLIRSSKKNVNEWYKLVMKVGKRHFSENVTVSYFFQLNITDLEHDRTKPTNRPVHPVKTPTAWAHITVKYCFMLYITIIEVKMGSDQFDPMAARS